MKLELYTDGGCRGNGTTENPAGGIGALLLIDGELVCSITKTTFFKPNTNNKTELEAVITGITNLVMPHTIKGETTFAVDTLTIYTDSNYVVQGVTSWIKGWEQNNWKTSTGEPVKNKELWMQLVSALDSVKKFYEVSFVHVQGHAGNKWNEECDRMANEAMDNF